MNTPQAAFRNYKISDSSMLQDSRTTQAEFEKDADAFENFDSVFTKSYKTEWLTAIDAIGTANTDEQVVDVQTTLTDLVEEDMEACRVHFQGAKYFIKKAFPNKEGIWNEFGFDNYDTARQSAEKMIIFMEVAHKVANKPAYNATLVAANYPQTNIDEFLTLRTALITAKTNQELAKNARSGERAFRVDLLNDAWKYRTAVSEAAKNIFINNYARYKVYLLPASAESSSSFSITGTATDKATGKNLEGVVVNPGDDTNAATTDSNGVYGIAKIAEGEMKLDFSKELYLPISQTINYDGKTLVVNVQMEKA
jgi:hypothetical protein